MLEIIGEKIIRLFYGKQELRIIHELKIQLLFMKYYSNETIKKNDLTLEHKLHQSQATISSLQLISRFTLLVTSCNSYVQ